MTIFIFLAIIKFLSPRKLFTYLKRRRNEDEIVILNETLRVRCRLNNVSSNLRFLSECLFRGVVPKRINIDAGKVARVGFSDWSLGSCIGVCGRSVTTCLG